MNLKKCLEYEVILTQYKSDDPSSDFFNSGRPLIQARSYLSVIRGEVSRAVNEKESDDSFYRLAPSQDGLYSVLQYLSNRCPQHEWEEELYDIPRDTQISLCGSTIATRKSGGFSQRELRETKRAFLKFLDELLERIHGVIHRVSCHIKRVLLGSDALTLRSHNRKKSIFRVRGALSDDDYISRLCLKPAIRNRFTDLNVKRHEKYMQA